MPGRAMPFAGLRSSSRRLTNSAGTSLNWPAMTMGFAVKDKALLDKLAMGKKVEFVKEGKGYTVTGVK